MQNGNWLQPEEVVEQATAAPGEKRALPHQVRCEDVKEFGNQKRRLQCLLVDGHDGEHKHGLTIPEAFYNGMLGG